jgi:hypothetical protein
METRRNTRESKSKQLIEMSLRGNLKVVIAVQR